MRPALPALLALAWLLLSAATYEVGPGKPYADLEAVDDQLNPGDVVLVHPGTYGGDVRLERPGAPGNPITIRGVGAERPQLHGGTNTLEVAANNYVIERLDLSGGSSRCFYHRANDVVLRDTVIHDCPRQGLLGADNGSGTLVAEHIEVVRSGEGDRNHSIYMATDEDAYPGSVFRLRHSVVRDATGGNAIKSRAERNEIAYNRIEAGPYHALELIGPDPAGGTTEAAAREDSDVVGNVIVGGPFGALIRVGGDATGQSHGRYRFAFNTMLASSSTSVIFRAFDAIDSIEAHGNVIAGGAPSGTIIREAEAAWETTPRGVGGDRNWVRDGWTVPGEWTNTLRGADPGFEPGTQRPAPGSPLLDAGPQSTTSPPGHDFPGPLFPPAMHPPSAAALAAAEARPPGGPLDIGAFERGTPVAPGAPAPGTPGAGSAPGAETQPTVAVRPGSRPRVRRRGRRLVVDTGQTVRCPRRAGGRCRVVATIRRVRGRPRILGATRFTIAPGRSTRVRVVLNARGSSLLRRSRRLRARVTVSVRTRNAAPVFARRALRLRAPGR